MGITVASTPDKNGNNVVKYKTHNRFDIFSSFCVVGRFLYNLTYTSFFLYSGYDNNVYLSFALAAVAEVPASLITMALVERVGRRKFIMPLTLLAGVSCLLIAFLGKNECIFIRYNIT